MNFPNTIGKFYESELIEKIKDLIKRAESRDDSDILKYFGYALLGKIEFERNIFPVALTHFEEALKYYEKIESSDTEEKARLFAWIGLTSFKLGNYEKAINFFSKAIEILSKKDNRSPIIGELKALLADALFFKTPEEAIVEAEYAHELLKENPSPFLLSNAVKLGTGLIVRNYVDEGYKIILEAVERIPDIVRYLNMGFIKTLKILEGNAKKSIFYIEPYEEKVIKNMIFSLEGLKSVYYTYNRMVKLKIDPNRLLLLNSKIVSSMKNIKKLEETLAIKNEFMNRIEMAGVFSINDYPIYRLEEKIDHLINNFGTVAILSFIDSEKPYEYRLFLYITNRITETIKTSLIEIDDSILESRNCDAYEASKIISKYIPTDILDDLSNLEEGSLVIISPSKMLYEVPWELIPYNSKTYPYLGLATHVTYVASLYDITFWERESFLEAKRKYLVQVSNQRKKIEKKVVKILQNLGYWPYNQVEKDLRRDLSTDVSILYYANKAIEVVDGDTYISIGKTFLSSLDIERIKFRGRIAILDSPNVMNTLVDNVGAHNLPISFILSGFRSVIAFLGNNEDTKLSINFMENLAYNRHRGLIRRLLFAKKILFEEDLEWWRYIHFGNPITVL